VHDGATPGGTKLARLSDVGAGGGGIDPATLARVATSGSYNDLTNKPAIPAAYSLPAATATALGGVKVGGGVTVAADGTISVAASTGGPSDISDYVIASATGLSGTNYNNGWYRKYKSGWVEQGGHVTTATGGRAITLPVPMANANYTRVFTGASAGYVVCTDYPVSTAAQLNLYTGGSIDGYWEVKGMAA